MEKKGRAVVTNIAEADSTTTESAVTDSDTADPSGHIDRITDHTDVAVTQSGPKTGDAAAPSSEGVADSDGTTNGDVADSDGSTNGGGVVNAKGGVADSNGSTSVGSNDGSTNEGGVVDAKGGVANSEGSTNEGGVVDAKGGVVDSDGSTNEGGMVGAKGGVADSDGSTNEGGVASSGESTKERRLKSIYLSDGDEEKLTKRVIKKASTRLTRVRWQAEPPPSIREVCSLFRGSDQYCRGEIMYSGTFKIVDTLKSGHLV